MSALDYVILYHEDNCQSGSECDLSALSRAELSALRAENAELKAEMEQFDEHHRRVHDAYKSAVDTVEAQARQLKEARESLHGMIDAWRDYANGHYCLTYNPGMTQGLNCAADALEAYVSSFDAFSATAPAPFVIKVAPASASALRE